MCGGSAASHFKESVASTVNSNRKHHRIVTDESATGSICCHSYVTEVWCQLEKSQIPNPLAFPTTAIFPTRLANFHEPWSGGKSRKSEEVELGPPHSSILPSIIDHWLAVMGKYKLRFDLNRDLTAPRMWFDQTKIWFDSIQRNSRFDSDGKDLGVKLRIRNNATNVSVRSALKQQLKLR